ASRSLRLVVSQASTTSTDNSTNGSSTSHTYATFPATTHAAWLAPSKRSALVYCDCRSTRSCDLIKPIRSGKTPYVRFDGNDYSIPHALVRKPLTLVASHTTVRLLDGAVEVARHPRCWDKQRQIESEAHLAGLADEKRKARSHRGRNRLGANCPSAAAFLEAIA